MRTIDLNTDVGEVPERARSGVDDLLIACVTSVNVACGGHAGDTFTMESTVASALRHGAAIGAHPSYPDREGFGRRAMEIGADALQAAIESQISALSEVCGRYGARIAHVKPHGALYHRACRDRTVAASIARAVERLGPEVVLVGLAGAPVLDFWRDAGRRVAAEAFADRRYEADGTLRSRSLPDASIVAAAEAAEQAVRIARGEGALTDDRAVVPIEADTICVHGDGPYALDIARAVRRALELAGFRLYNAK